MHGGCHCVHMGVGLHLLTQVEHCIELFQQPPLAHRLYDVSHCGRQKGHNHGLESHHQVLCHAQGVARRHGNQRRPHGDHGGH